MTVLALNNGQSVSFVTGLNQASTIWSAYAGSTAVVTVKDGASGSASVFNLGPGVFRYTTPAPKNTVTIAATGGMIYYEVFGAVDRGSLQQQSIRTTTAEPLADVDADTDVIFTAGGATTATVSPNVPAGWAANCIQRGGLVTFSVPGGALISRQSFTKTAGSNAMVTLRCISNTGVSPQILLTGDGQV